MIAYLNVLLYLFLYLPSCTNNKKHTADSKGNNDPLDIEITYNTQAPEVEPLLYGTSTSSMYWQTNPNTPAFATLVDSLHMNVMRWPGGTLAQFYHWDKPGYGLIQTEISALHSSYANSLKNQNAYVDEKSSTRRYIDDFVLLAQKSNAQVLVCANLVTASDEENIALLDFLTEKNIKLCGVELGNELYLPRMRGVFNDDVQQYINRSKTLTEKIKKKYPSLPVAVCAAPIRDIADENPPAGSEAAFFSNWNQKLSKQQYYDAVILHYYFPIPCDGTLQDVFACATGELNDITGKDFRTGIDMYRNTFGSKPFWITEWNIATKATQGRYGNTLLQNFFITRFYDAMNAVNAKYPGQIGLATYQTLAGDVYGSCMIMDKNKRETYTDTLANPYIRKMPYYAHQLIRHRYTGKMIYCDVKSNRSDIYLSAYYNKTTGAIELHIEHIGKEPMRINSILVNGKAISTSGVVSGLMMHAPSLYAGYGLNKADIELSNHEIPKFLNISDVLKNITISKYSYGYLQLNP